MRHVESFIIVSGGIYGLNVFWRMSNRNLVIKLKELPIDTSISVYSTVLYNQLYFCDNICIEKRCYIVIFHVFQLVSREQTRWKHFLCLDETRNRCLRPIRVHSNVENSSTQRISCSLPFQFLSTTNLTYISCILIIIPIDIYDFGILYSGAS